MAVFRMREGTPTVAVLDSGRGERGERGRC